MVNWTFAHRRLDEWTTQVHVVDDTKRRCTWDELIAAWRTPSFADAFTALIGSSPSQAVRWECPPLNAASRAMACEFVVLDDPKIDRPSNRQPFDAYLNGQPTATFANLGRDAILVIPGDVDPAADYAHLASFARTGRSDQHSAFWAAVADALDDRLSRSPVWLSTAGDGVAWLHVRLDDTPKYYHHPPYQYQGF